MKYKGRKVKLVNIISKDESACAQCVAEEYPAENSLCIKCGKDGYFVYGKNSKKDKYIKELEDQIKVLVKANEGLANAYKDLAISCICERSEHVNENSSKSDASVANASDTPERSEGLDASGIYISNIYI
ncbi:hypothetical protein GW931_02775 [archaeon]|nr:hypothetical protein [archaeon]